MKLKSYIIITFLSFFIVSCGSKKSVVSSKNKNPKETTSIKKMPSVKQNAHVKKLLKEHFFNSTTTDKRSKIIILFNSDSLRKIPLRLIFKKKVLLFNLDDEDKKPFFRYFVKKRFIDIYNLRNKYTLKNQKENLIDFGYIEVNKIIKEQYKYITNEK